MTTLADVNNQLVSQNDILESVDNKVGGLSSGLRKFIEGFAKNSESQKLKDLEEKYEARNEKVANRTTAAKVKTTSEKGTGLFGGMLSGLAGLIPAGLSLAAAGALVTGLLKKGTIAAIAGYAADEIAKQITDDAALQSTIAGAFKGGLLAKLVFGRFTPIGAALGAIIGSTTDKEMEELEKSFVELGETIGPKFRQAIDALKEFSGLDLSLSGIVEEITETNRAIVDLLSTDSKNSIWTNLLEASEYILATLGGLAYAIRRYKKSRVKKDIDKNVDGQNPLISNEELDKPTTKNKQPPVNRQKYTVKVEPTLPDEKPKAAQPKMKTAPLAGYETELNGKKYRWMGASWAEVTKNGKPGLSAPKDIQRQLSDKFSQLVDDARIKVDPTDRPNPNSPGGTNFAFFKRLLKLGGGVLLGLTPNTTADKYLDSRDPSKYDTDAVFGITKSDTAGILADQAEIRANYVMMEGGIPMASQYVDQSSVNVGGSNVSALQLPAQRNLDTSDPKNTR